MDPSLDPTLLTQLNSYIGSPRTALPTPSCCISLPTFEHNVKHFHDALGALGEGYTFRAHLKTHKTIEGTRLMLANGKYKSVIVSTLRGVRALEPLVKEGVIDDILYGLPPAQSYIPQLSTLTTTHLSTATISLLIDNPSHIKLLRTHPPANGSGSWPVFVKLDVGSSRAGLPIPSDALAEFLKELNAANGKGIRMRGFYIHAGHSYSGSKAEDAKGFLEKEVNSGIEAVKLWKGIVSEGGGNGGSGGIALFEDMIVSIGATPTAHVIPHLSFVNSFQALRKEVGEDGGDGQKWKFEIHAGNFPLNDLQQLATAVLPPALPSSSGAGGGEQQKQQQQPLGLTINAEVVSVYPHRNEALINAGTLAIGREPGQYSGYARVRGKEEWVVGRISQEHGILTFDEKSSSKEEGKKKSVEEAFKVGDRVVLDVQHACIAAAGHDWYFVLDEKEDVKEIWWPWRGWH